MKLTKQMKLVMLAIFGILLLLFIINSLRQYSIIKTVDKIQPRTWKKVEPPTVQDAGPAVEPEVKVVKEATPEWDDNPTYFDYVMANADENF